MYKYDTTENIQASVFEFKTKTKQGALASLFVWLLRRKKQEISTAVCATCLHGELVNAHLKTRSSLHKVQLCCGFELRSQGKLRNQFQAQRKLAKVGSKRNVEAQEAQHQKKLMLHRGERQTGWLLLEPCEQIRRYKMGEKYNPHYNACARL